MRPATLCLLLLLGSSLAGCTSHSIFEEDGGAPSDGGGDAGLHDGGSGDAGTDAGNSGSDAGTDAGGGVDAGSDAGSGADAGSDAGSGADAGSDAGSGADAGSDAGVDAGTDGGAHPDAGSDGGVDAGMDAGVDGGIDAGADAGSDAGTDAGVDAGVDAGSDGGCGNGFLDPGEECDDGNQTNFDGCSATCRLEEGQRVNWLQIEYGTSSACSANAIGGSVMGSFAQGQIQGILGGQVTTGAITILLTLVGTPDPGGQNQTGLDVGIWSGAPEEPAGSPTYNGNSDLDWWYLPDPNSIDDGGAPLTQLRGQIASHTLTVGPGSLSISFSLGSGSPGSLSLSHAVLHAPIGAVSAPLESSSGLPPGHLASERVSPSLQTVQTTGADGGIDAGTLCGNVSALSLSQLTLPSQITQLCSSYSASNSMLDLLVGGCKAFAVVTIIAPTQPDQTDSSQPRAGSGSPYTLSASSGSTVDTCKDQSDTVVDLNACLAAAAYSSFFEFATDRVIIRE